MYSHRHSTLGCNHRYHLCRSSWRKRQLCVQSLSLSATSNIPSVDRGTIVAPQGIAALQQVQVPWVERGHGIVVRDGSVLDIWHRNSRRLGWVLVTGTENNGVMP